MIDRQLMDDIDVIRAGFFIAVMRLTIRDVANGAVRQPSTLVIHQVAGGYIALARQPVGDGQLSASHQSLQRTA